MSNCNHTKQPDGYIQRLEWLERMSKRYKQVKCDTCGLWAIWKRVDSPDNSGRSV